MIQLFRVSKAYPPNVTALKNIDLQIGRGEFVFLTGPSGAGKTTLLRLLFREEQPTEGRILVNGQNVTRLTGRGVARLRQKIGLVFQEFKLLPRLTALENVALAAEAIGKTRRESEARAYQLLCDLGLKEKCRAKPPALSGGEQQRVAIARALVNDPQLILADEPTGNVDAEAAGGIMRLFSRMRETGATVVVASHDLDLIKDYGSRVISLRGGSLVDDLRRVAGRSAD
ncbi:MAG TPA: cell division ATP-binding protein FtsE [candidate division Zixibacteria bacterium]|nr:cell division ATP-binding protein FtsE [candidate division Zixibacteria bacterium]